MLGWSRERAVPSESSRPVRRDPMIVKLTQLLLALAIAAASVAILVLLFR